MGFGKDVNLSIVYDDCNLTVSSLASLDVIGDGGNYNETLKKDFRVIRMDILYAMLDGGNAADQILFGIADSDLSDSEIEACIEGSPQEEIGPGGEEATGRPVFPVGTVQRSADGGFVFNNGVPFEKTVRWTFHENHGWQWWAYNPYAGALGTPAYLRLKAKIYGVWVR